MPSSMPVQPAQGRGMVAPRLAVVGVPSSLAFCPLRISFVTSVYPCLPFAPIRSNFFFGGLVSTYAEMCLQGARETPSRGASRPRFLIVLRTVCGSSPSPFACCGLFCPFVGQTIAAVIVVLFRTQYP